MPAVQGGHTTAAQALYEAWVPPKIERTTTAGWQVLISVDSGGHARTDEEYTAAASLLATMLKADEAEGMIRYLTETNARYESHVLEQVYLSFIHL